MNNNELIKYFEGKLCSYESMITANEELDKEFSGYEEMTELYREKRDRTKYLLSILSRTRIREIATEPPTREDADQRGLVVAYSYASCFGYRSYKEVVKYPKMYLFWSCIQQLPEVTP